MTSIFDLNIDELQEIIATDMLPEDVTLEGIENRKDFNRLFANRIHPRAIAEVLCKEQQKVVKKVKVIKEAQQPRVYKPPYESIEPLDTKNERLRLKQLELSLKNQKMQNQTQMYQNIYNLLQSLEEGQGLIISALEKLLKNSNEFPKEVRESNEL